MIIANHMIANRTQEVLLFEQMVAGSFTKRVLLIEGKSGFGKTWLLARLKQTLPLKTLCVQVDFKLPQPGIPDIFFYIRRRLGKENFPQLNAASERYLSSGIQICDTTMIGKDNQFSVVLSNLDESTRNFRLTLLREAFFEDLRKIPQKLVFLFDSYEKAPTELANWLEGEFLAEVVYTPKLIVVIAGQQIPQATIEWIDLHHCCSLEAILELKAWCEYAQNERLSLNHYEVNAAMVLCKGQPAEIAAALKTLEAEARKRQ
ncbi:MAG: hypothetical protein RMX68_025755 [Aulosira sp. ZfuVER01]|nr:hypothetical protein [Aulosira sp. ZfuVER01]MDZ8001828.1 hypothetical protein [Aulosira sp. DedVER01a]MDZ8053303.1 hypothetical protein [Aulosira sp. ZfuCHP01]